MSETIQLDDLVSALPEAEDIVRAVMAEGSIDLSAAVKSNFMAAKRVSVSDLVPEEYQMRLMALDVAMSRYYWEIGDIAQELIGRVNYVRAAQLGRAVTHTDVFEAIGFFCHRTERTVRYYWEIAHFFPQEVRSKWDVSFAVWGEARWADDWELMLQIAEENPQMGAQTVRAEYYRQKGEPVPVADYPPKDDVRPDGGAEVSAEDLPLPAAGEEWPDSQPRFKSVLLARLEKTIDALREVLDRIPLPTDVRVRIGEAILELQGIGLDVRREV